MRFEIEIKDKKLNFSIKFQANDFLEISFKNNNDELEINTIPKDNLPIWVYEQDNYYRNEHGVLIDKRGE